MARTVTDGPLEHGDRGFESFLKMDALQVMLTSMYTGTGFATGRSRVKGSLPKVQEV